MREIKISQDEMGGYVITTPTKTLKASKLEAALSEIRSIFKPWIADAHSTTEVCPCPHCGSSNTVGHGIKEAHRQIYTRRICKDCNKTFNVGKEPKTPPTKEQVRFLMLMYSPKEIARLVNRSYKTVCEHISNIKIEEEIKKKAEDEASSQVSKGKAEQEVVSEAKIRVTGESALEYSEKPVRPRSIGLYDTPEPFGSILAQEFDRTLALKERIGMFTIWQHNGTLAALPKGSAGVVYLTQASILHMKKLRLGRFGKEKLGEYTLQVPEKQRHVVRDLVETLIDEDLGCFPMLRVQTRVGDSGELDA